MGLMTRLSSMLRPKPRATESVGGPGFVVVGGYLQDQERHADLRDQVRFRNFRSAAINCGEAGLSILYFLDLLASVEWRFDPPKGMEDDATALEVAAFVERTVTTMTSPWPRVIRRLATFKIWGASISEWTSRPIREGEDQGKVGFLDVEERPIETIRRWDTDRSGTVQGVWQEIPQDFSEAYLPRWKMVYLVDDSLESTPRGTGLMRLAYQAIKRVERYLQLEGYGFETDLRGTPIARAPLADIEAANLSAAKKAEILAPVRSFVEDHYVRPDRGVLLDSAVYRSKDVDQTPVNSRKWDLEIIKGGNTTQEAINTAINRELRRVARVLGTEAVLLGDGERGSNAMHESKVGLLRLRVDSTLLEVAHAVDYQLVATLLDLNGIDQRYRPRARPDAVKLEDVLELAEFYSKLAAAGAPLMPGDPAINHARSRAGAPPIPEDVMDQMVEDAALRREAEVDAMRAKATPQGEGGDAEEDEDAVEDEDEATQSRTQSRRK